ncbi:MAG: hypothetical protein ACEQSK_11375 [Sphingomonadaceae bacterium]
MRLVDAAETSCREKEAIRKAQCAAQNRLLLKLCCLNLVVDLTIYGASTRGEPGAVVESILLPLAVVSAIALAVTMTRRVMLLLRRER